LATPSGKESLTPAAARVAEWALPRDVITRAEAEAAVPDLDDADLRGALSQLRTLGILLRA
jgi:hypothetical protein